MVIDLDEGHRKRDERTDVQVDAATMHCAWVGIRKGVQANVRSRVRSEIRAVVWGAVETGVTSDVKLGVWADMARYGPARRHEVLILDPDGGGNINNAEVNMRDKVVTKIETQVWAELQTASQVRVRIGVTAGVGEGVEMGMNPFLVA